MTKPLKPNDQPNSKFNTYQYIKHLIYDKPDRVHCSPREIALGRIFSVWPWQGTQNDQKKKKTRNQKHSNGRIKHHNTLAFPTRRHTLSKTLRPTLTLTLDGKRYVSHTDRKSTSPTRQLLNGLTIQVQTISLKSITENINKYKTPVKPPVRRSCTYSKRYSTAAARRKNCHAQTGVTDPRSNSWRRKTT